MTEVLYDTLARVSWWNITFHYSARLLPIVSGSILIEKSPNYRSLGLVVAGSMEMENYQLMNSIAEFIQDEFLTYFFNTWKSADP